MPRPLWCFVDASGLGLHETRTGTLFPALNAISSVHDPMLSHFPYNLVTNVGTMAVAAPVTYGALLNGVSTQAVVDRSVEREEP